MQISVIAYNIWAGKHSDKLVEFAKQESPDILLLQEVSSGLAKPTQHADPAVYAKLKNLGYFGVFSPMWLETSHQPGFEAGLAILSKFPIQSFKSSFYHKNLFKVSLDTFHGHKEFPGLLLSAQIQLDSKIVNVATTHFIWAMHPDSNHDQAAAMANLAPSLKNFNNLILGGDFNFTDDYPIYKQLSKQMIDDRPKGTTNTLHKTIHKLQGSKDLAVDYLFHKGAQINLIKSQVLESDASDHLPVKAIYEIS